MQILIDRLGGIHNVHLARLWNARRVILVEGDDLTFLKTFHTILHPDAETPLDAIPNLSIGGWDGWAHAIGSNMALKNAVGEQMTTYCIFDRDFHTIKELQARHEQAATNKINLHIWQRKEIENYLLNPEVIARAIKERTRKKPPSPAQVAEFLERAADEEKDNVLDALAAELYNEDRKLGMPGAYKSAREQLKTRWGTQRINIASGKVLISRLSSWAQTGYGASIGANILARNHKSTEIPEEMRTIITCIHDGTPFPL